MPHYFSEEAEAILDQEYKVLDSGFVRLVDYMGSDKRIVDAARVSYGGGTKTVREDKQLIEYLMRNNHSSPFEQVVLTFHCKMPIFIARQWIRHRTARVNEISGRYSEMRDDFYFPPDGRVKAQGLVNRQGSDGQLPEATRAEVVSEVKALALGAYQSYQDFLKAGVSRELARIVLPLNLYTEWYWQIDLHNLFHFLELRLHPHAQEEIRDYAKVMLELSQFVAPLAIASFKEHRLGGQHISSRTLDWLSGFLDGVPVPDHVTRDMKR